MNFKTICISVLSILLIVSFISCSQQKTQWQGTIEEVDGVTVVKNPIEPMYECAALAIEEELTIGEPEGREEYMFVGLTQITVDDRGYIYAVDLRAKHVKVFDGNGEYIRTIGKAGQGPGEFQLPAAVYITPEQELLVFEMMKISFFTLD